MNEIQSLRGTADILPPQSALWNEVERKVAEHFERYGYELIRTPIIEQSELFLRSIGEDTDIVEKEMYTFSDRKGRSVTLRPEGTACVVRAAMQHELLGQKIRKFYYMGPMFRYERPQAGRQRQFNQLGVEMFGTYSPLADAETISMMVRLFEMLGLKGVSVNINTLGDKESLEKYRAVLRERARANFDKFCPDCQRRMEKNVLRLLDCKVPSCKEIFQNDLPAIKDCLTDEAKAHYETVLKQLDLMGIKYVETPQLVRGLDYYTHTIFEVTHNSLGSQDALGGGGRYNDLVESMGGAPTGAVGFAIGEERLMIALAAVRGEEEKAKAADVFLVSMDEEAIGENLVLSDALRTAGISVALLPEKASAKSQFRQANASGAPCVLIRGGDERGKGIWNLKMMESGEQKEFTKEEILSFFKE
ncbi:histidine--tRNA ligase [bacterium]|nr:histidine--tRNA ligase [bacterium]